MPVLYPTFTTLAAELGDTVLRTLQKILQCVQKTTTIGTALTSNARTVTTTSATIDANGARGIIAYINVTAASGTGGLVLRVGAVDPVTLATNPIASLNVTLLTTGLRAFSIYPGNGGSSVAAWLFAGTAGVPLPSKFNLSVTHADASSYTYSVTYELIP